MCYNVTSQQRSQDIIEQGRAQTMKNFSGQKNSKTKSKSRSKKENYFKYGKYGQFRSDCSKLKEKLKKSRKFLQILLTLIILMIMIVNYWGSFIHEFKSWKEFIDFLFGY